jgi:hypothetical protein
LVFGFTGLAFRFTGLAFRFTGLAFRFAAAWCALLCLLVLRCLFVYVCLIVGNVVLPLPVGRARTRACG